jgi:hypothetical protein
MSAIEEADVITGMIEVKDPGKETTIIENLKPAILVTKIDTVKKETYSEYR